MGGVTTSKDGTLARGAGLRPSGSIPNRLRIWSSRGPGLGAAGSKVEVKSHPAKGLFHCLTISRTLSLWPHSLSASLPAGICLLLPTREVLLPSHLKLRSPPTSHRRPRPLVSLVPTAARRGA